MAAESTPTIEATRGWGSTRGRKRLATEEVVAADAVAAKARMRVIGRVMATMTEFELMGG